MYASYYVSQTADLNGWDVYREIQRDKLGAEPLDGSQTHVLHVKSERTADLIAWCLYCDENGLDIPLQFTNGNKG